MLVAQVSKRTIMLFVVILFCLAALALSVGMLAQECPQLTISSVAWSPDGTMLAVSSGSIVQILDTSTSQSLNTLSGFTNWGAWGTLMVAWSPDSSELAIGTGNDVQIWAQPWNPDEAQLVTTISGSGTGVRSIAWSPDRGQVAISAGGITRVYSSTGVLLHEFPPAARPITQAAWNQSGAYIAQANYDGFVTFWDASNWGYVNDFFFELNAAPPYNVDPVNAISWNSDGSQIAIATDYSIHIGDAATFQVVNTFLGHTDRIRAVDWSAANLIASGGEDNTVRIWDPETGEQLEAIQTNAPVFSLAWSPDGTRLAYGGSDGEVHIIAAPATLSISSVAWSPDGSMIAGAGDGLLRIWDAETGITLHDFQDITGAVNSVVWSPDSTRIASGGDDTIVRIWDAVTGQLLATLQGHEMMVVSVAWSPDGSQLASASFSGGTGDYSLRIWDGVNYQPIAQQQSGSVNAIAWNPNPTKSELAVANENGHISVEPITATAIQSSRFAISGSSPMFSIAWNSNGDKLASGDVNGTIDVWDTVAGNPIATFSGHTDLVGAVAWSPDDTRLASASSDNTIRVWDVATGQTLAVIPNKKTSITTSIAWSPDGTRLAYGGANGEVDIVAAPLILSISSVAWSPDGSMIAGAGANGLLRLWDADTGAMLQDFSGIERAVTTVAWSPDGTRIASGGGDNTVRIWDIEGPLLATIDGHLANIMSVVWSPDGSLLASATHTGADPYSLRIWDGNSYQPLFEQDSGDINTIAWNPDSSRSELAIANENHYVSIRPITSTGILSSRLAYQGNSPMFSVAWNSDGSRLASGDVAGQIDIWDTTNFNNIGTFIGHTDLVGALAWSPHDTRLASASSDNTIRIWDVATGQTLAVTPNKKTSITTSIAWSPDGTQLAYGGSNGEVHIIAAPTTSETATPAPDASWSSLPMETPYPTNYPPDKQTLEAERRLTQQAAVLTPLPAGTVWSFLPSTPTPGPCELTPPPATPAGDGELFDISRPDLSKLININIINKWYAEIGDRHLNVFAGSDYTDPTQGMVYVAIFTASGSQLSEGDYYPTADRSGAVQIVGAQGQRLILVSEGGETFYFDVPGQQFTASLTESVPTVTPWPITPHPTITPAVTDDVPVRHCHHRRHPTR